MHLKFQKISVPLSILTLVFFYLGEMNFIKAQSQAGGFDYNWTNYPTGEFGPIPISFDYTGIRSIEHAPATGIHPRIFFGPTEFSEIQNRMLNTTSGQAAMAQIHAYTTLQHKGYVAGGYNHNTSYGLDSFGNRYIGNAGKWDSHNYYYDLINEVPGALSTADNKRRYLLCSIMACEAFECMVYAGQTDPDTGLAYDDRALDLAKAMTFWAGTILADPNIDWTDYLWFGGEHMAHCYDLNFNNMTTTQQDTVRMALAQVIPPSPRYGSQTDHYSTTSNWVGLNTFELIMNLAIENEPGYNASLTEEYMRSYRNFLTYGWYESGVPYEGMGKNYQFVSMLVAASKRGYSLLGHPNVKSYGENFLPAITQPYGHAFIGTDVWGGTGWDATVGGYKFNPNDVVGLKWAFPNSSKIDFVWRNFIEKSYDLSSSGYVYQQVEPSSNGYHTHLLVAAIFAQDYTAGDWETQNQSALGSESFYGEERGLGIIRSGYEEEDLLLHFHCRQDMGGHTHGDRNSIAFSGLGRIWFPYSFGGNYQETAYHSCILVDDVGISINNRDGRKARMPGTILNFNEQADFAEISGDATYAYTWEYDWESRSPTQDHSQLGINGWEKELNTWNDFRSVDGIYPYHNIPLYDFAHWNNAGNLERIVKRQYNSMQRVYRTAAMFRGDYPFALIIDDVQKDNTIHNYKWLGQIAKDLEIESTDVNLDDCDYRNDVIVSAPGETRKMLLRVLNFSGTNVNGPAYKDTVYQGTNSLHRLVVESNAIAPDFKILLYPFNQGDPLPITTWNAAHDSLLVSIGGEDRLIDFTTANGLTSFNHDNTILADIDMDAVPNLCDICPGGNDFTDTNFNNLPDDCEPMDLDLNVMLEGPFMSSSNLMRTELAANGLIPMAQPYNAAPYNYAGTEMLSAIPSDMVDWILVEVRKDSSNNSVIHQQAAILLSDGRIRDLDGSSLLRMSIPANSSYFFVVRHRNHLDVMCKQALTRSLAISYDFRTTVNQAFQTNQQKLLSNGQAAMFAGDINHDHVLQTTDYNQWKSGPSILNTYNDSDLNLDGTVQTTDYDLWYSNKSKNGPPELDY